MAPCTRNSVRKELQKIVHRAIEKYKLRSLRIVPKDGVTISDYCERTNEVKQAIANLEEKDAKKCEPRPLLDGGDWIIAKEEPKFLCDVLYVRPNFGDNGRIRKYELNRRSNWSSSHRTFFQCTQNVFEMLLQKGLTFSKVTILPPSNEL